MAKIVETDNFDDDYPNEQFLGLVPQMPEHIVGLEFTEEEAQIVADALNSESGPACSRFYKVVPNDYVLQPGFLP